MKHPTAYTLAVAALVVIGGCGTPRDPFINWPLHEPFDAAEMSALLAPGSLGLTGSALLRQQGGGVVSCAGGAVHLTPDTAYARERIEALYSTRGPTGYRSILDPPIRFNPEAPQFHALTREATCDAQGNFSFSGLLPGAYFVSTQVIWRAGYMPQGGFLMARVVLADGSPAPRIVLSSH